MTRRKPPQGAELLDDFRAARLAVGVGLATVRVQDSRLVRFARFADIRTATAEDVRAYLVEACGGLSMDSRRLAVSNLRALFAWMDATGVRIGNPLDGWTFDAETLRSLGGEAEGLAPKSAALIGDYLAYLDAQGASAGTLRVRRSWLARFARACPVEVATEADVIAFMRGCADLAPQSRRAVMSSLQGFYSWAVKRQHVAANPAADIRPVRVNPGIPKPIPEPVLADALRTAAPDVRRMLLLGAYAGLRRAEIARVHSRDVSAWGLSVRGKGDKSRLVPLHPRLRAELDGLDGWAFPSPVRPGMPVSAEHVGSRLESVLPEPWTTHSLRHRFATMSYRGTHDIRAVQQLLGHASPATTAIYTLVGDEELAAAVGCIP